MSWKLYEIYCSFYCEIHCSLYCLVIFQFNKIYRNNYWLKFSLSLSFFLSFFFYLSLSFSLFLSLSRMRGKSIKIYLWCRINESCLIKYSVNITIITYYLSMRINNKLYLTFFKISIKIAMIYNSCCFNSSTTSFYINIHDLCTFNDRYILCLHIPCSAWL